MDTENKAPENTEQQAPVITTEDVAREQGWRPKEEWDGDPTKWVSAETFVAKGELISKIESLGKKLKDSEKAIKLLTEHNQKIKEKEFQRAVEYLKTQKKAAYESGDVDKIIEIDDKIAEVKQKQKEATVVETTPQSPEAAPEFIAWKNSNPWYGSDSEMTSDADAFGNAYAANNPDKTPEEVLTYVSNKIKKTYKEKFENQNRAKAPAVESGGRRQETKEDHYELSQSERKAMNTFVRMGLMTEKEYIAQLRGK